MNADAIAVVVVTFESEETLDACLLRLRAGDGVHEIRVVDNDSRDSSLDIVQRHALADARLRFIANPDNPGFATACNQGAAASSAPWLAFVNPDCFVDPDTLAQLRAAAVTLGDALVGGVLRGEDGTLDTAARRRDPDFAAMLRTRSARDLSLPRDPEQPLQPVDAVSGALLLLPRALFARIGGFDEGYRLHAEDLDLCRRVRQVGGVVAIANEVEVLHVRGVSSRARPLFVEWHKHRGLWRYFRKFEASRRGRFTRAAVFAMIWGRFPLAALRAALRR
ncbi:MAG: glycosyltransferase family 2 protein [Xanthomonadaceae bacterium]|nr:glycosyltransferase family 2 protein [Xanthomonadaceae bacterium]